MIINQVIKTNDYNTFKVMPGNRPVNKLHVKRLSQSMEEKHLMSPILVNEKMQVIDGQHRLEAQKSLKLPVFYIVNKGYGKKETHMLNSNSKDWKNDDFMDAYANQGLKDYITYREFKKEYGFGHRECQNMLLGTLQTQHDHYFRSGKFKILCIDTARRYAEQILMCKDLYVTNPSLGYRRRGFVNALLTAFRNPYYDHSVFIRKLRYQNTKLVDCTNEKGYLTLIEIIYNFNNKKSDKMLRLF